MNNPLKYTDPTGYQTVSAPGAVSWLGGGGGWGESGRGFGGNVNWDYFVPNTSWYQYYGNYAYDTYNWSTGYYEHHTLEGVETISYEQAYARDLMPYASEFYFGAAAGQKYKAMKKAYLKRLKQILEELGSTSAFLHDLNQVITEAGGYGMMFDGPGDPPGGGDDTYMAGAFVLSGAMITDDVTGVGVFDDFAIPFILIGGYVLDRILSPNLEGTHESLGFPFKEVHGFDNKNPFNNGPKMPSWLKAAVWAATGGGLYYQWYKVIHPRGTRYTKKNTLIINPSGN